MLSKFKNWLGDEIQFKLSEREVKKEITTLLFTIMLAGVSSFFINEDGVMILSLVAYIGLKYLQRGPHHA
tara:strand:+ start:3738 stop:3947 length:210 start_codon:yes stop_codon:yes gene_type:complete